MRLFCARIGRAARPNGVLASLRAPWAGPSWIRVLALGLALVALSGCAAQSESTRVETPLLWMKPVVSFENSPRVALTLNPVSTDMAPTLAKREDPIRAWTEWEGEWLPGVFRSRAAHERRLPIVTQLFAAKGLTFPPAEMAFVAFKDEKELEVWGAAEKGGEAVKVATYTMCAASGILGPKRYEGDHQVPEGFYVIQYGWAESNYHLEMKVSYPNLVDKVLGPKNRPLGGEIMIHGKCASIGCMSMGDERAEELWVMMKAMGDAQVKVHIYPARDMDALLKNPEWSHHHGFWSNLKEGYDLFKSTHQIPKVRSDWHGVYMFNETQ